MKNNIADIIRSELLEKSAKNIGDDIDNIPIPELGIDSLDFFDLIYKLEDEFDIELPVDQLDNKMTLRSLIESIENR